MKIIYFVTFSLILFLLIMIFLITLYYSSMNYLLMSEIVYFASSYLNFINTYLYIIHFL